MLRVVLVSFYGLEDDYRTSILRANSRVCEVTCVGNSAARAAQRRIMEISARRHRNLRTLSEGDNVVLRRRRALNEALANSDYVDLRI